MIAFKHQFAIADLNANTDFHIAEHGTLNREVTLKGERVGEIWFQARERGEEIFVQDIPGTFRSVVGALVAINESLHP